MNLTEPSPMATFTPAGVIAGRRARPEPSAARAIRGEIALAAEEAALRAGTRQAIWRHHVAIRDKSNVSKPWVYIQVALAGIRRGLVPAGRALQPEIRFIAIADARGARVGQRGDDSRNTHASRMAKPITARLPSPGCYLSSSLDE